MQKRTDGDGEARDGVPRKGLGLAQGLLYFLAAHEVSARSAPYPTEPGAHPDVGRRVPGRTAIIEAARPSSRGTAILRWQGPRGR
jgi:hypothetical protein